VVVANASGMRRSLHKGVASAVPFAKIMRGLRRL